MSTIAQPRHRGFTVAAVVAAIALAIGFGSVRALWPEASDADAVDPATPAWFEPIASYYGDNPKVTPSFRFADLYTGDPMWFGPIAEYYHFTPGVTSAFDFARLYGAAAAVTTP
jgi:hypothetical protein